MGLICSHIFDEFDSHSCKYSHSPQSSRSITTQCPPQAENCGEYCCGERCGCNDVLNPECEYRNINTATNYTTPQYHRPPPYNPELMK